MGRIKALLNAIPETLMPRLAHRLFPLGLALIVIALVAGCQLSGPGTGAGPDGDVTPNAVAGDAIEVTALDAPPSASAPDAAGAVPAAAEGQAPAQSASPAEEAAPVEAADAEEAAAEPAPQPAPQPVAVPAAPEEVKSDAQRTCEKRGGTWSGVGSGVLRTCVYETKDAGKRCERESQCEGVCLARSGTCSPIKPLLGCNEILQDNGARVTLCIE